MYFTSLAFGAVGLRNLVESKIKTGMSQRQLAKNIGISHGTVNNILAGIIPTSTKTLDKLAEYFNVSVESLRHDGGSHAAEPVFPYGTPTKLERLIELAQHLDREELATLERCAEAGRPREGEEAPGPPVLGAPRPRKATHIPLRGEPMDVQPGPFPDLKIFRRRVGGLCLRSLRLVRYCARHELAVMDGEACRICRDSPPTH